MFAYGISWVCEDLKEVLKIGFSSVTCLSSFLYFRISLSLSLSHSESRVVFWAIGNRLEALRFIDSAKSPTTKIDGSLVNFGRGLSNRHGRPRRMLNCWYGHLKETSIDAPKIHQWTIYFCRWGYGWVGKAQCFWSAGRFAAAGSSLDVSRVFYGMALLGLCLETFFQCIILPYPVHPPPPLMKRSSVTRCRSLCGCFSF